MMKKLFYFLFIANIFLFVACQTEEYEVVTDQDQNSISPNSEVYDLVFRTSMYDGSLDDEIDGSPCFTVEFPYTVVVGSEFFNINSEAERQAFLVNLPSHIGPEDIQFNFPINIKNMGHQTVKVVNIQQFKGLQQGCRNAQANNRTPITCVQFTFPFRITSYNRASQQIGSAVLTSQKELYEYFENIPSSTVINFEYPFLMMRNNMEITIANQNRLYELLKECVD